MYEDPRFPLSLMQDNILHASDPPPPILERPMVFKNGNNVTEISCPPSRPFSAVSTEKSCSLIARLADNSVGGGTPSDLFCKSQQADVDVEFGETATMDGSSSSESSPSFSHLEDLDADARLGEDSSVRAFQPGSRTSFEVDKDAESAIHALLALQRAPSPQNRRSPGSSPEPYRWRPPSPSLRQSAIQKGPGTEASRFICKFPRCGKAYASTDAVRKHCRQRHLDWLRRLGHGCPALYCRWED